MTQALEEAVQAKDAAAVVAALSTMSETDREAAREPFLVWLVAMGMDRRFTPQFEATVAEDDPAVLKRREADGIVPMSRKDKTYDRDMDHVARLAEYGLYSLAGCRQTLAAWRYEAESARILADRRPPWLSEWLQKTASLEEERGYSQMTTSFWCHLFCLGLVDSVNEDWVTASFVHELPSSLANAPDVTQKVLRKVPSAAAAIYELPKHDYQLTQAKDWTPVVQFLGSEGLLDHVRLLTACTDAIERLTNQTERNGSVILAKAVSHKSAKCSVDTLAALQKNWVGLLSDQQTAVAGFGLEQLVTVEKAGLLKVDDAVSELPHIFQHKAKNHATKAVKLLHRLAQDEASRSAALLALASSLSHANKDVQEAGLECLAEQLRADDKEPLASVKGQLEMVAATLRPRSKKLIDSLRGEGVGEAETLNKVSTADVESLIERAKALPADLRELFQIDAAIDAASGGDLASVAQWRMSHVHVLASQPKLQPIESLDELFDVAAAAVERCESADVPEQIVDGIMRYGTERPESFNAQRGPLAKRACCEEMDRPNRGIVGGVLGDAFAELIAAWLDVPLDDDIWRCDYYPMAPFLREVAALLKQGRPYQLLSTPTHAGGWIDPRVWVTRVCDVDSSKIGFLENDLVRSLLRLTPDSRDEALQMMSNGEVSLSERFEKLTTLVLDLHRPNDSITLDDSWSPFVWMTAIRARDAWIDLQDHLSEEEQGQVAPELWTLPDVLKPCDYHWQVKEAASRSWLVSDGLVNSRSMPGQQKSPVNPVAADMAQALEELFDDNEADDHDLQDLGQSTGSSSTAPAFLAAQLNQLACYPAPQYIYPYLATQWPMKLEWCWNLATIGLSRRVESGPSVDERYDQFLLPLFESDRPVCRMAARALWIATVSKDGNAKGMATEVWITVIAEDRLSVDVATAAWQDVFAGGWMKMNRVAEVFTEVLNISPLHASVIASTVEEFLAVCDDFPRDTAKLLQVLDECNERLGRAVRPPLSQKLSGIKSGKAKKLARALLDREDQATMERFEAAAMSLDSRIKRAERNFD